MPVWIFNPLHSPEGDIATDKEGDRRPVPSGTVASSVRASEWQ